MLEMYRQAGPLALGSRLRQLGEALAEEAARVNQLYQTGLDPKWFPVFFMLRSGQCLSISTLADAIGHSHASVSKIAKEMVAAGLLENIKLPGDARVNQVCLSESAKEILPAFEQQNEDAEVVVEGMLAQCSDNLWQAINEFEGLLEKQSFHDRVRQRFMEREQGKIAIVDASKAHFRAFKELNYDWIQKYFDVEDSDRKMLEAPQEYVLDKGGAILMADYEERSIGTCALLKTDATTYELAKMAVDDEFKGRGIGFLLGEAALQRAKELGGKRVFLDSNTTLQPAINLYRKLGFKRMDAEPS
ncbi:MAG: bifunctional helix-turn-helix transcriptional regulator/GNAT family N-acetyltransferase, partial [Pseudomonadales bacterium]|nr:bifunctional helix-turn-helix transcriptional regulator/GNAT family N-acetyltransferase [Pseudomonadales bacterium]